VILLGFFEKSYSVTKTQNPNSAVRLGLDFLVLIIFNKKPNKAMALLGFLYINFVFPKVQLHIRRI